MRRLIGFILLSGLGCWAQVPSALQADPLGWKDIMPSPSFEGWTRLPFMVTTAMNPASQWKVDAAANLLICEGDKGHEWLRYDKELTDAIFHAEYRFTKLEGSPRYNSGVMLRNNADGTVFFQAEAGAEGTGYLFGSIPVNGALQRFNMRADMKESPVKPAGEWNIFEVRAEGPKMTVWVNGAVTAEKSDVPVLKGYAGLEAEGFRVEFRNLKLKELK